jgi:hypothetical protein
MNYGEGDQDVMDKICANEGWPTVPFPAYVRVHAIVDGTLGAHMIRGIAESVFRDYPRDLSGAPGPSVCTFAKIRLEEPVQGIKRGQMIEVIRAPYTDVEPIGPLDLMIEEIQ